MTETMRAIEIETPGGPEALKLAERPIPQPGPREVLVKVAAAGVNRPDVLQRLGLYPPPPGAPDIPGLEIAGEVVGAGVGASDTVDKGLCSAPGAGEAALAVAVTLPGTRSSGGNAPAIGATS